MPSDTTNSRLSCDLPVWGFFGRCWLHLIGMALIVPAPWTGPIYYRFMVRHVSLPNGRRLLFNGTAGDIWLAFLLSGALGWAGNIQNAAIAIVCNLLNLLLIQVVLRWVCGNTTTPDGQMRLSYTGGMWGYIGWSLLLALSFITIIGWAWALAGFARYLCRHVEGTHAFSFAGSGWSILWRCLLALPLMVLIIPIPWVYCWITTWLITQIDVTETAPATNWS